MCCILSFQVLAPALNDNLLFHAFFLYNIHDIEWAHNVIQKLESQRLGFKCCCPDRDFGTSLTQPQVSVKKQYIHYSRHNMYTHSMSEVSA